MPTYSYFCPTCEKKFDAFHSMSCTDPQLCPVCGTAGKKLLSASSIIFKGTGFYTTDYRNSGYVEAQNREKDEASPSAAKTDKKSDDTSVKPGAVASSNDSAADKHKEQACAA